MPHSHESPSECPPRCFPNSQNVSAQVRARVPTDSSVTEINGMRTTSAAVDAVFAALRRRLAVDPALPLDTSLGGWQKWGSSTASVDIPDDQYYLR